MGDGTEQESAETSWSSDRTTFQRVYDVLVGTAEPADAGQFAEWADCSETGARSALSQLVEMGIAETTGTRPKTYRRNPSYVRWRRVERLAREYDVHDLRARLDELLGADDAFQDEYGVPDPDAVVVTDDPVDDHAALHDRWESLTEWRTVRRDIGVLTRAIQRAETAPGRRART